jgi:hypothetical protein
MERRTCLCLVLAFWLGSVPAVLASSTAREPEAVQQPLEASMRVTGEIDVEPDGSVGSYRIDDRDQLPAQVVELLEGTVRGWAFEPVVVDGTPVRARSRMHLRILASQADSDSYALRIGDASFGGDRPAEFATAASMPAPAYPVDALRSGVTGTVYLVLKVDRRGRVANVVVEQVNLHKVAGWKQMSRWRKQLARAALAAARDWTFNPPTRGDAVDDPSWSVRMPLEFRFYGEDGPGPGEWQVYVPGPRQVAPWLAAGAQVQSALLADGGAYPVARGLRLLGSAVADR